jgi:hypothetical protein
VSPYYYDYYPVWYSPWRPQPWNVWHTRVVVYNRYYCVAPQYRIPEAHHYYGPRRVSAPEVRRQTERYVAENGGRSNFTYGKSKSTVESPRSIGRSERPGTLSRTDQKREQNPVTKSRSDQGNIATARKPDTVSRSSNKREESPVVQSRTENRRQETTPSKPSRGNTTATRPATENRSSQSTAAPKRESQPRSNSNKLNQQNRSGNNSSPKQAAPTRTERKAAPAAAPKANRTESMNSRPKSSTGSKAPVKTEGRQSKGGRG